MDVCIVSVTEVHPTATLGGHGMLGWITDAFPSPRAKR